MVSNSFIRIVVRDFFQTELIRILRWSKLSDEERQKIYLETPIHKVKRIPIDFRITSPFKWINIDAVEYIINVCVWHFHAFSQTTNKKIIFARRHSRRCRSLYFNFLLLFSSPNFVYVIELQYYNSCST